MKKVAFIDLDGVVADSSLRFTKATKQGGNGVAASINWDVAFNPELIELDKLIENTNYYLHQLELHYTIVLLSSRPEVLRDATNAWLVKHAVPHSYLVLKPKGAQYIKTTVWKAVTLETLVLFMDAKEVIFVDDELANRAQVVSNLDASKEQTELPYKLWIYTELNKASIESTWNHDEDEQDEQK